MISPGVPAGMTNAEMPSSVRAVTVTIEVIEVPQLVMNALAPSITHSSPSRRARVRVAPASLPPSGLGQPERAERATGDQVGQPALLLLVVAEPVDRVGAEADAGRQRDAHRLVDPAELLDRHAQRGEVAPAAAPLLGEDEAEQPEVAHRQHGVDREVVLPSHCGHVRRRSPARRSPAPPCGTPRGPPRARTSSRLLLVAIVVAVPSCRRCRWGRSAGGPGRRAARRAPPAARPPPAPRSPSRRTAPARRAPSSSPRRTRPAAARPPRPRPPRAR